MILRKLLAASALMAAFAAPAAAADGGTTPGNVNNALLQALSHCAAIEKSAPRLACYDGLAPRVSAALGGGAAAKAAVASKTPTPEEEKSWFGFDLGDLFGTSPSTQTTPAQFGAENTQAAKKQTERHAIDSITAGVTEYAHNPYGKFIVFLDNGQVWEQLRGDGAHAKFKRKAADNTVRISRGFLGSYNLVINDQGTLYKVKRIK